MLPNSKSAKDKDERAAILKNAGPSKDMGNKIIISTCSSLESESKLLHKTMCAPGISTFVDMHASTSNPFIAIVCTVTR